MQKASIQKEKSKVATRAEASMPRSYLGIDEIDEDTRMVICPCLVSFPYIRKRPIIKRLAACDFDVVLL